MLYLYIGRKVDTFISLTDGGDFAGVKIVVEGLNVQSTSVYWVACPSVCQRAVQLRSLTEVDRSFVLSSMPFDGTGLHVIRRALIVAAYNGTSVRLELPGDGIESRITSKSRQIHLEEFQTFAVESPHTDLTRLSVEAKKPVFVSVSVASKLDFISLSTSKPTTTEHTHSESSGSVKKKQIVGNAPSDAAPAGTSEPNPHGPDVGSISASRDSIASGPSDADRTAVVAQMESVGRLGLTYVLTSTGDIRRAYRIAGAY